MRSFCRKTCVHKIPRFGGGEGILGFFLRGGGRGECRFYFYGRADFSDYNSRHLKPPEHFQNSLPLSAAWFPGSRNSGHVPGNRDPNLNAHRDNANLGAADRQGKRGHHEKGLFFH